MSGPFTLADDLHEGVVFAKDGWLISERCGYTGYPTHTQLPRHAPQPTDHPPMVCDRCGLTLWAADSNDPDREVEFVSIEQFTIQELDLS